MNAEKHNIEKKNEKLARELIKIKNNAAMEANEKEGAKRDCLQLRTTFWVQNKEICRLKKRIDGFKEDASWVQGILREEMNYAVERNVTV